MPTSEELSRQYAEMTDVAFSQLKPTELTPEARKCYEEEARKRKNSDRILRQQILMRVGPSGPTFWPNKEAEPLFDIVWIIASG